MTHRFTAAAMLAVLSGASSAAADKPAKSVSYDADVKPIFRKHCLACHNPERPRGELDLSTYAATLAGSASGKPAIAGQPEQSLLYTLAAHLEDPHMPPNKPKLPQREIDVIRTWIETGLTEHSMDATTAADSSPTTQTTTPGLAAPVPFRRPTPVTALAVSPTEPIAAVSGLGQVLLLDLVTGKPIGGLAFPEGEVHSLKFAHDGKLLLAGGGIGGASGVIIGYELPTGQRLFTAGEELDTVLTADMTADRSRVVIGGPSRVVKVLSPSDGKSVHVFRKPTDWVTAVGFSPEGLLVAAGDRFGGGFVWEANSGQEFLTLRGHTKGITGLAWQADSNALATASDDGTVRVWDMHTGRELAQWEAHPGGVTGVAFHPNGRIATGGRDRRVKVWDKVGQLIADLGPAADVVTKIGITHDGLAVVSGDWSGAARVWPVAGGEARSLSPSVMVTAVVPAPAPQMRAVPVRAVTRTTLSKIEIATRELAAARESLAAANRALAEAERALKELAAEQKRP